MLRFVSPLLRQRQGRPASSYATATLSPQQDEQPKILKMRNEGIRDKMRIIGTILGRMENKVPNWYGHVEGIGGS